MNLVRRTSARFFRVSAAAGLAAVCLAGCTAALSGLSPDATTPAPHGSDSTAAATAAPMPPPSDQAITITASGSTIDDPDVQDAISEVLELQLEDALPDGALHAVGGGVWSYAFAQAPTDEQIATARAVVANIAEGGLFDVWGVGVAESSGSASFGTTPELTPELVEAFTAATCLDSPERETAQPDVGVALCDAPGEIKYLLGPNLVAPSSFRVSETADSSSVGMAFDAEGTSQLAEFTRSTLGLMSPDNQLALVAGGSVLFAPATSSVILDGKITVSGNLDDATREAANAFITVWANDVQLSVQSP